MRCLMVVMLVLPVISAICEEANGKPGDKNEEQPPKENLSFDLGWGERLDMVLVKSGEFQMGGMGKNRYTPPPPSLSELRNGERRDAGVCLNEGPIRKVTISKPFYIGRTEVTVEQFKSFVRQTQYRTDIEKSGKDGLAIKKDRIDTAEGVTWKFPGVPQTKDFPVVQVSWNDAHAFVEWASKKTKKEFRLPTEAEWEYAARGPKSLEYPFGDRWDGKKANHADTRLANLRLANVFGTMRDDDGYPSAAPVGRYDNASWCGALDMAGNVSEWCQDWAGVYEEEKTVDPKGAEGGPYRIMRGGNWMGDEKSCRSAHRAAGKPDHQYFTIGFRIVMNVPEKAQLQP